MTREEEIENIISCMECDYEREETHISCYITNQQETSNALIKLFGEFRTAVIDIITAANVPAEVIEKINLL